MPCGSLNSNRRSGSATPIAATTTPNAIHRVVVARPSGLRIDISAVAIGGASSGSIGTMNRAGALLPPHHMCSRAEPIRYGTAAAISATARPRRSGSRTRRHVPTAASAYTGL